jgi:hypothetical protein
VRIRCLACHMVYEHGITDEVGNPAQNSFSVQQLPATGGNAAVRTFLHARAASS